MIAFIQPFGLHSPSGGARIFRSLLRDAPFDWLSVVTGALTPPPTTLGLELHVPLRPYFGRIERTRFGGWLGSAERLFSGSFRARLAQTCRQHGCTAIHGLTQGRDFWYAYQVARELEIPFHLSVHDDLVYALKGSAHLRLEETRLQEVWRESASRFVISEAMGEEYCRRYGRRRFEVVTDGLERIEPPKARPDTTLRIYFMGLLHISYTDNFRELFRAISTIRQQRKDLSVSITCRCGSLPKQLERLFPVTLLPMGSEQDVERDMETADLLYLPLPFDSAHETFVRYSLSTKMITYLGSGLPILYHGPRHAAAGRMLDEHGAALSVNSLEHFDLIKGLVAGSEDRLRVTSSAAELGRQQFLCVNQRGRFHRGLSGPSRPSHVGRSPLAQAI